MDLWTNIDGVPQLEGVIFITNEIYLNLICCAWAKWSIAAIFDVFPDKTVTVTTFSFASVPLIKR